MLRGAGRGDVVGDVPAVACTTLGTLIIATFWKEGMAGDHASPTCHIADESSDIRDLMTGRWQDATTPGQRATHLDRYTPSSLGPMAFV